MRKINGFNELGTILIEGKNLGTETELRDEFDKNLPKYVKYLAEIRKFKPGKLPNNSGFRKEAILIFFQISH